MEKITAQEVATIIAKHSGNAFFARTLQGVTKNDRLLCLLAHYIQFNAPFVAGVANLAGSIAARQDLFRDQSEPMKSIADRSVVVASHIFAAAIDEFGDRIASSPYTHRTLAQHTLQEVGNFWDYTVSELDKLVQTNNATELATKEVLCGYGVDQTIHEEALFRAIGFHMGSETLAHQEFRLLDNFLQAKYPNLVDYLKKGNAYLWIQRHTHVEAEHFAAALVGANLALVYYAGKEPLVREWILEGVDMFASVQKTFMEGLFFA